MEIGSDEWKALVVEGAGAFGLPVAGRPVEAFAVHAREMLRWTRVTNLTAITDPREIALKHVVDALAPAALIPARGRLLDAGTGAGFPGIPLKIVRPSLAVTLVDSSRRKVSFLKHVIRTLALEGIEALQGRMEDLARRPDMAMAFDVVICRALTDLQTFVAMALPLMAAGGLGVALRGAGDETEECASRRLAGGGGAPVEFSRRAYRLPFDGDRRVLVTFRRPPAA